MSFVRRMLSGDYRRAVAAEAAGEYAEAARHYALCGERAKVAEMHLLRAERATAAGEKLDELRDALRWADKGEAMRPRALLALGRALLARARSEGTATVRDAAAIREAAAFLGEAGEHLEAGAALELIGDDEEAAKAYERGGHVDEMEQALHRERDRRRKVDRVRDGFARYKLFLEAGRRDEALAELTSVTELAEEKGEYRRLLDELAARVLATGAVTLRRLPDGRRLTLVGMAELKLGRDPALPFAMRDPGISRTHALLRFHDGVARVRDAGSRLGTWLAGLRLEGEVPLEGRGELRLGECDLAFESVAGRIRLQVTRGLDRGALLVAGAPEVAIALADLPDLAVPAHLSWKKGRPILSADDALLAGARVRAEIQLVRGDVVTVAGVELEVT